MPGTSSWRECECEPGFTRQPRISSLQSGCPELAVAHKLLKALSDSEFIALCERAKIGEPEDTGKPDPADPKLGEMKVNLRPEEHQQPAPVKNLKALGESGSRNKGLYIFDKPDASLLERVDAAPGPVFSVNIEAPEFTSLCPVTGQPDFGNITINYLPDKYLIESKSLKLYLMGYRNNGCFHETIIQQICADIAACIDPQNLQVVGKFAARGGISINPVATFERDAEG